MLSTTVYLAQLSREIRNLTCTACAWFRSITSPHLLFSRLSWPLTYRKPIHLVVVMFTIWIYFFTHVYRPYFWNLEGLFTFLKRDGIIILFCQSGNLYGLATASRLFSYPIQIIHPNEVEQAMLSVPCYASLTLSAIKMSTRRKLCVQTNKGMQHVLNDALSD